jgi:hypothetical protein
MHIGPSQASTVAAKTAQHHAINAGVAPLGDGTPHVAPQAKAPAAAFAGLSAMAQGEPLPLPDPKVPVAPHAEVHAAAAQWHEGAVNDFEVYDLLRQAALKNLAMASTLQRGGQAGVYAARTDEVQHTREQQKGQAHAAKVDLVGSALVCAAATAVGFWPQGDSLGLLQHLAPSLRELGRPGIQLFNQTHPTGGVYTSNQAALAIKRDGITAQAHTTIVDTSRATADQAREELRNVLQLVQGHLQRVTDVSDRIAR